MYTKLPYNTAQFTTWQRHLDPKHRNISREQCIKHHNNYSLGDHILHVAGAIICDLASIVFVVPGFGQTAVHYLLIRLVFPRATHHISLWKPLLFIATGCHCDLPLTLHCYCLCLAALFASSCRYTLLPRYFTIFRVQLVLPCCTRNCILGQFPVHEFTCIIAHVFGAKIICQLTLA